MHMLLRLLGGSLFSTDFWQTNAMSGALNRSFYTIITLCTENDGIYLQGPPLRSAS